MDNEGRIGSPQEWAHNGQYGMTIAIETTKQDGRIYVAVRGTLNARYAPELESHLRTLAPSASNTRIVLDLEHVPFLDSMGISALINGFKIVRQHGGELALTQVSPEIMDVFRKTLLTEFLVFE